MRAEIYEEWLKINIMIHNNLTKLSDLEKEKDFLIKDAETGLNDNLKKKMNANIKEYENLLREIKELRNKAEELKNKV